MKQLIGLAVIGLLSAGTVSAQSWGGGRTAFMAVYENYGLIYDSAKSAYCYQGKIVGLLADEQARGKIFLSPAGQVHLTVTRDTYGKITGLLELSRAEYEEIVTALDAQQVALRKMMQERQAAMLQRRLQGKR